MKNFLHSHSFFHSQTRFLDAHGGHYTTIVYIHYGFFLSLQSNSRKNYSLLLNVESSRFLLALNSLVFFGGVTSGVVGGGVVNGVVNGVVATGGSLCYYTSANQQSQERKRWEDKTKWGYDIS